MTSLVFDETWFYAPIGDDEAAGSVHALPADEAHHAARVLRLPWPHSITLVPGGRIRDFVTSRLSRAERQSYFDQSAAPELVPELGRPHRA